MKPLCFGNRQTSFLEFRFSDVAPVEGGVEAEADLHVQWFGGLLPLFVSAEALQRFLGELGRLDESLKGTASLQSAGGNGAVTIQLTGLPLGHLGCSVNAQLDGNSLICSFQTDQTQLRPLHAWWRAVYVRYETAAS